MIAFDPGETDYSAAEALTVNPFAACGQTAADAALWRRRMGVEPT
jgi:hypothetical protein